MRAIEFFVGLIGGLVAWLFSAYFDMVGYYISKSQLEIEKEKSKLEIVDLIKDKEPKLALALIDYFDEKHSFNDLPYKQMLSVFADVISTDNGQLTKDSDIVAVKFTDVETVVSNFSGSSRRTYSDSLVKEYNDNANARQDIVSALLGAISEKNSTTVNSYRVNLYIALTFSRLPAGALETQEQKTKLAVLRGMFDEAAFRQNVANAFAKQGIS